jgi:hypothetical protein
MHMSIRGGVSTAREVIAADLGEKLVLEGIVCGEDNTAHTLVLDDGSSCQLIGGTAEELSSIGIIAVYDSFVGMRVKVYGQRIGSNPLVLVNYMEPILL